MPVEHIENTNQNKLEDISAERQQVTGQEIYTYAMKMLGINLPTESQKLILEELKKQGDSAGDKQHWKPLIDL